MFIKKKKEVINSSHLISSQNVMMTKWVSDLDGPLKLIKLDKWQGKEQ